MKTIKVKASVILAAMERGKAIDSCWQAGDIEILLLPSVYKRWQELNARFPYIVNRVDGLSAAHMTREDNMRITDWTPFAGYELRYANGLGGWNQRRANGYMHSASVTWDGIRRETIHNFIWLLGAMAYQISEGKGIFSRNADDLLQEARIVLVDDVTQEAKVLA